MPYPKQKSENYTNFGGINQKASQYITDRNEFLVLQNVDFRTVGSLSSFCGSTLWSSDGATSRITGFVDFSVGFYSAATFSLNTQSYALLAATAYDLCNATGGTFLSLYHYIYPSNPNPMALVRGEYVYGANGLDAFIYQGVSFSNAALQYGLPKPFYASFYAGSFLISAGGGLYHPDTTFTLTTAWLRNDGLIGPPLSVYVVFGVTASSVRFNIPSIYSTFGIAGANGISTGSFGITAAVFWGEYNGKMNTATRYLGEVAGVLTFTDSALSGGTFGNSPELSKPQNYLSNFGYGASSNQGSYVIEHTYLDRNTLYASGFRLPDYWPKGSYNPSIMNAWENRLYLSGFSEFPDTIYYSNPGEYEVIDPENSFEVGHKDGDMVSCLVSYFTQQIIFKTASTWSLTGDPDDIGPVEATPIYGCVSPKGACVWEQRLWFLDRKGIAEFNGANTKIVSDKMQPYFDRMNVAAARSQASMIHVKERNEVWCAIPVDGSDTANVIVIYDYLADAWTTRIPPVDVTAMAPIANGNNKQQVYSGGLSGTIYAYGNSFTTDNGAAFTCVIKSRYLSDLGHSVDKMFRRLFLDAVIPPGSTQSFLVNFYADQSTTPTYSTTMVLSDFQNRIDYGVSGKDMAVELIYGAGQFLQINGFTIEYRFQRAV
jgi:hypothetical protein